MIIWHCRSQLKNIDSSKIWTCTFRILACCSTCWAIKSQGCEVKSCMSQLGCISFEKMCSLNNRNRLKASDAYKNAKANLSMLLDHWIKDSEDSVYTMVSLFFFDPKNWTDEKNYRNNIITSFANHFQAKLLAVRYDSTKVLNEITLSLAQYCWNQKRAMINALRIVQLAQIILKILIFFMILIMTLLKQKVKKMINIKINRLYK